MTWAYVFYNISYVTYLACPSQATELDFHTSIRGVAEELWSDIFVLFSSRNLFSQQCKCIVRVFATFAFHVIVFIYYLFLVRNRGAFLVLLACYPRQFCISDFFLGACWTSSSCWCQLVGLIWLENSYLLAHSCASVCRCGAALYLVGIYGSDAGSLRPGLSYARINNLHTKFSTESKGMIYTNNMNARTYTNLVV
jgi:hypothetical protein